MLIHNPQPHRTRFQDALNELKIEVKARLDLIQGNRRLLDYAERRLGYRPDLKNPKTFNEKINWRKIYDRNPLYVRLSDKVLLREELVTRLGQATAASVMTELYAVTDQPETFDFAKLPSSYVVKANHASGWNAFVTPNNPLDENLLREQMAYWLRRSYGKRKQEWAYQPIKRQVMFEEFLFQSNGKPPDDMKFMIFDGECKFAVWDDDRFGAYTQHYMDSDWQQLHFTSKRLVSREMPPKPQFFDEMLALSEKVAKGIDCVRVDFMFTEDRFVLNEMTFYRGSGMERFDPPEWDQLIGDMWTLSS